MGEFEDGKLVQGRFILPDGSYYEGPFRDNKANGKGKFIKDRLKY